MLLKLSIYAKFTFDKNISQAAEMKLVPFIEGMVIDRSKMTSNTI